MTTETLGSTQASGQIQAPSKPVREVSNQLGICEKLVDELLKTSPDEAVVLPLMAALEIPQSSVTLDRIAGVFEKLESLMTKPRDDCDEAHSTEKNFF